MTIDRLHLAACDGCLHTDTEWHDRQEVVAMWLKGGRLLLSSLAAYSAPIDPKIAERPRKKPDAGKQRESNRGITDTSQIHPAASGRSRYSPSKKKPLGQRTCFRRQRVNFCFLSSADDELA